MYPDCIEDACKCIHTSQTFLFIRPVFQSASPEYVAAFRDDRYHAADCMNGAFQFVPLGGQSTNGNDLARYFMPFCKNTVTSTEDLTERPENSVDAQHFNIFTEEETFASTVRFEPKHSFVGFGFHYWQGFAKNEECGSGYWFSVSFPVVHINNDMGFCEDVLNTGGGPDLDANVDVVANMTEAFVQSAWNFGKITRCSQSKTGIPDIEIKLGYEWLAHDPAHFDGYIGVVIPTGNRPTGEFLFEPIIGNGQHFGLTFGLNAGFELWQCVEQCSSLRFEEATHSRYLFGSKEIRSFDLNNRPWSRYMQVYEDEEEAAEALQEMDPNSFTPGINIFTQDLHVTPGFNHTFNSAFVFTRGAMQIEAGYNFYYRDQECVKLDCRWIKGPALKSRQGEGTTTLIRTITPDEGLNDTGNNVPFADYDNSIITQNDLDLRSAAMPAYLSNTVYLAGGLRCDERENPVFVNIGGSYEFSGNNNAVVNRWMLWGKTGISF